MMEGTVNKERKKRKIIIRKNNELRKFKRNKS